MKLQPCNLTPDEWLRAVRLAFAREPTTIHVAEGLVHFWKPSIRLSSPRVTQLADHVGLHHKRVGQRLARLVHAGALSRIRVGTLTVRAQRTARRADPWGVCYALGMTWAARILDQHEHLTIRAPASAPAVADSSQHAALEN